MKAHWLDDGGELTKETLLAEGIPSWQLPVDPGSHAEPLATIAKERGYIAQDQVALTPETPNLEAICHKFLDEHLHDDDEVRFVLEGEGVFDIRSTKDRWMRVTVQAGDMLVVPAGRYHRFFLTDLRTIRCVRLFMDASGWVPRYRSAA